MDEAFEDLFIPHPWSTAHDPSPNGSFPQVENRLFFSLVPSISLLATCTPVTPHPGPLIHPIKGTKYRSVSQRGARGGNPFFSKLSERPLSPTSLVDVRKIFQDISFLRVSYVSGSRWGLAFGDGSWMHPWKNYSSLCSALLKLADQIKWIFNFNFRNIARIVM